MTNSTNLRAVRVNYSSTLKNKYCTSSFSALLLPSHNSVVSWKLYRKTIPIALMFGLSNVFISTLCTTIITHHPTLLYRHRPFSH